MIPVNLPKLGEREKELLVSCIDSGWVSSEGPCVREFEDKMAAHAGRKFGIAVCNGTAALDVAIAALEIGPGDEVIVPTFTIISCVHQLLRCGAKPVFVDCEADTWNLQVAEVESKLSHRTRAILAVHIYGLPVDMQPLLDIAAKHGLAVIEDAAEAIGQTYQGKPCGSFGDLSTFSFYPNKLITTGEGGMVLTDDPSLAERCRASRNLCFQAGKRFYHEELGWNYGMTNMQAALGIAQLERLQDSVRRKRQIGRIYDEAFRDLQMIQRPVNSTEYAENIYWVYGVILMEQCPFDANEMIGRLQVAGVGSRPFFWPMHEQPVLRKLGVTDSGPYPHAERIARRGLYLPSGLGTGDRDLEQVIATFRGLLQ